MANQTEAALSSVELRDRNKVCPVLEQAGGHRNRGHHQGVATTDLTIELALSLIATPKKTKPDDTSKGKPDSVVKGSVEEPGNEPPTQMVAPDIALEGLATDE